MTKQTTPQNNRKPQPWQINPANLTADHVQVWSRGVLVNTFSKELARSYVLDGRAFIINDQAIGRLTPGGVMDS